MFDHLRETEVGVLAHRVFEWGEDSHGRLGETSGEPSGEVLNFIPD